MLSSEPKNTQLEGQFMSKGVYVEFPYLTCILVAVGPVLFAQHKAK